MKKKVDEVSRFVFVVAYWQAREREGGQRV